MAISPARLAVLRAARERRLLYRPEPEAWAVGGDSVSAAARSATRAGLLAGPPSRFGSVGLTAAGEAALDEAEGRAR